MRVAPGASSAEAAPLYEVERFTFGAYLRDRWLQAFMVCACSGGVVLMLAALGLSATAILAVAGFMVMMLAAAVVIDFLRRRRFWYQLGRTAEGARRVSEVRSLMDEPEHLLEGRIASQVVERLSDLANGELTMLRRSNADYRDYIELWIHETKTPIAAAKLVAQRIGGEEAHSIGRELERIERQVEQALYYARSTAVANDYEIREVVLAALCAEACKRNGRFLIEQEVTPHFVIPSELTVLTDAPWLLFMLSQVVVNAAQYQARTIVFSAEMHGEGTPHGHTVLEVRDDGVGIAEADMARVFDRGFTGTNGRARGTATGMGLYLVASMATSLGLGLSLRSEEGVGTTVVFDFPHDRSRMA